MTKSASGQRIQVLVQTIVSLLIVGICGGGYPDGIAGDQIPEETRIIAVADAYDAMTSRRSYRDVMPQDKVRSEIEKGMNTQFEPRFAKIMLQMIDEDTNYSMHEKSSCCRNHRCGSALQLFYG